jgi:hypothetical protein
MRIALALLLALATASCATGNLADEPQDLVAQDQRMTTLLTLGWEIDSPIEPAAAASLVPADIMSHTNDSQTWSQFLACVEPGDELRPVRNNAGKGHAIFRQGRLVSLYLSSIY